MERAEKTAVKEMEYMMKLLEKEWNRSGRTTAVVSILRELTQMERGIAYGRNNDVSRSGGRNVLSESHIAGGENRDGESRKVRSEGSGILEGEPQREIHGTGAVREAGRENAGSGGGSVPDDGHSGGRLLKEESAGKSAVHNGNLEAQGAGENAGRGAGDGGSSAEIPLVQHCVNNSELNF